MGAWLNVYAKEVTAANGVGAWWAGIFYAASAFCNCGLALIDTSMIPFQGSIYPVLTLPFLILAGHTCYPIFLRLILFTIRALLPVRFDDQKEIITFILNHPRRCYTSLFPSRQTWWVFGTVCILNGTDRLMFEVLNVSNHLLSH